MRRIPYKIDKKWMCLTPCPNGVACPVGSYACTCCQHHVTMDRKRHIVTCKGGA